MSRIDFYVKADPEIINSNDATKFGATIDISQIEDLIFYIFADTGAHANEIMELEVSPDGVNWQSQAASQLQGIGHMHVADVAAHYYARIKCQTAEGALSTVSVQIQGIRYK